MPKPAKAAAYSLTAVLALIVSGCIAHVSRQSDPLDDYRYSPPRAGHPPFDYPGPAAVTLSTRIEIREHHEVLRLSYPSSGENGNPEAMVEGLYFRSLSPGPKKIVIVLPIWGASTYPPSRISYGYAKRSRGQAHVLWLLGEAPLFPWDGLSSTGGEEEFVTMARASAERYRTTVVDLRRLLAWLEAREEIDPHRIGVVGFSMGALLAATTMGNDARVSAAVLMMGAANFGDVFASCGDRAGEVREHVMSAYGWSQDRYRDFFQDLFAPADPVHYEGRYDPGSILMIDALFDDCMPRATRDALWEVTGRPRRISFFYRHRGAFYSMTPLGLNFARRRIYRFLDRTL